MSEPHTTTADPDEQSIVEASTPPGIVAKSLSFMRQHWGKGVLLIVALIIAALAGPRYILGPQVAVIVVVQRDFVQSVVASGRVETPHRVNIGVQITGTVLTVPVNEGQQVRADTLLIELESSELQATVSQAQRAVQSAIAQQRQLSEVQIPMAQQTLREAQANEAAALQVHA
jgi:HlyD family secretion protein